MSDLEASWATTTFHLTKSRSLLPKDLYFEEAVEAEKDFNEYIEHNELGLALDAADQMGILSNAPNEFWQELEMAARNMGLIEEAKRFHDIQNT